MVDELASTRSSSVSSAEDESKARILIRPRRARPLFARHPWVFAGSIDRIDGQPQDGDEVLVCTHSGEFIARGLFNSQSQIRVRLYSWKPEQRLDESFFRDRLIDAVRLRRDILGLDDPRGAARFVFSEGDGLSGLIVDRYGEWLAVQFTSLALACRREIFVSQLVELCQPRGIYLRTERGVGELEGLKIADGPLWGEVPDGPVIVVERGLEFEVDLRVGQKTGFYLDQRENRRITASFGCGRRVLDLFCYSGAFSLSLAKAGATTVLGIDSSTAAIDLARRNLERNQLKNVRFEVGEAFQAMENLVLQQSSDARFDMIILDPPKFARRSQSIDQALRGYLSLNLLAVRLLEKDGILVTCSCSGHISREQFLAMLGTVAEQSGRTIQILAQLGQSPDHPVAATCPESQYLKCFIVRVTGAGP